jgi:hypothetical protein
MSMLNSGDENRAIRRARDAEHQALQARNKFERLAAAARAVYYAAYWKPDREVPLADAMWEELRDAAGFEKGHSPVQA